MVIREGVIPEGAVIAHVGNQRLVREGSEVVSYKKEGSEWLSGKRTQINDDMMPKLLMQYAVTAAYAAAKPVHMGMF
jgi:hypothetical protein